MQRRQKQFFCLPFILIIACVIAPFAGAQTDEQAPPDEPESAQTESTETQDEPINRPVEPGAIPGEASGLELPRRGAEGSNIHWAFDTIFTYNFETDLDEAGEVSVSRLTNALAYSAPVDDTTQFSIRASSEWSSYDFSGADELVPPSSDPFSDVFIFRVTPQLNFHIDEEWSVIVGGVIQFAGEIDADFSKSLTGGGFAGVGYQYNPDLSFALGIAVSTRLERDPVVVPYIALDWAIDEKRKLTISGAGGAYTEQIADDFAFSIIADYAYREYRLNDVDGVNNPIITDQSFNLGGRLVWSKPQAYQFYIGGGAVLYQEFTRQRGSDGHKLNKEKTDPTGYLEVGFSLYF